MKIIVCDPIDAESIDQMHQAGLEVDVRDSITSQEPSTWNTPAPGVSRS
jgi:hypothetical protein